MEAAELDPDEMLSALSVHYKDRASIKSNWLGYDEPAVDAAFQALHTSRRIHACVALLMGLSFGVIMEAIVRKHLPASSDLHDSETVCEIAVWCRPIVSIPTISTTRSPGT
jgi:sensor c-di-GMP phosphodiesterase-like protein